MGLSVKIAKISDMQYIGSLLQSYLRELSEFENIPLTPSGEYEYEYLPYYWTENTRWPYLFYFDGKVAGFAFVRKEKEKYIMAEFTVFREYRGYRFGLVFADEILQKHPGKWNIEYDIQNTNANNFWNRLVVSVAGNNYIKGKLPENREYLEFVIAEK
jgi:predicted acetyltransferase